jgi:uridine kinase
MAIRILLDHGVAQERIIFITFIIARDGGISVLRQAFPSIHIITGAIDNELSTARIDGPDYGQARNVWVISESSSYSI